MALTARAPQVVPLLISCQQSASYLPRMQLSESLSYLYGGIGRRSGLMVSVPDTGSSGPGSGPGLGHCVVFSSRTLYSHGASLHPGV